ncbi:hypothetical protein WR25_08427 [Diploscapter pachys]|uniref:Uncharacterized protein n=1 Tax=Diploscapter pachys TaxID=2018661 RepID=A0A2A2KTV6_9BILA|nr:hypothetical protein WR25_08427 [Diploscapter pachys]
MLDMGAEQMANRVNAMIVSGLNVENKKIAKAIKRCPAVLWARNPDEMIETASMLRNFFTKKQISYMIYTAPEILLMNFEELEEKYEYVFMHMNIENEEISKSKMWVKRPLEEIMERHQFLVKCGRYRTPDEKRPQIKRIQESGQVNCYKDMNWRNLSMIEMGMKHSNSYE